MNSDAVQDQSAVFTMEGSSENQSALIAESNHQIQNYVMTNGSLIPKPEREVDPMLASDSQVTSGSKEKPALSTMPFIMMLLKKRLHFLPIVTAIWIVSSFIISYVIAVCYGHVEPDFPYISYTAISAPERCIFSLMVNMGSFMLAANVYIKYKQTVQAFQLFKAVHRDELINKISLIIGLISAFGLSIVANFQTVDARPGHYIGVTMAFGGGLIYCWMQTSLSIRYHRWSCVAISQLVNSIMLTSCFIIFGVSKAIFKTRESQGHGTKHDTLRPVYLTSTVFEWLLAISLVTFVLTFYRDFSRVHLRFIKVEIQDQEKVKRDYHRNCRNSSEDQPVNEPEGKEDMV
ncbi:unnamed protein product [Lymnaea stagnalis]|uniref:CWH43-like N-terminal domain-containing protein n=1 Tax=Lymnaea stagnalis TaxID=6523 RepID=A0AAV2HMR9_LYMST